MNNYYDAKLLPMPEPKPYSKMTDEELKTIIETNINHNILLRALIEENFRKDKQIAELTRRIAFLEDKTFKKHGRPKKVFFCNGQELTDDYLIYLIDYDYFTICELEKEVGAGKNQLRNRYNKAKKKEQLERKLKTYGNS
jgi:hypothetical protein